MVILVLMDSNDPKMSITNVFDAAAYPRFCSSVIMAHVERCTQRPENTVCPEKSEPQTF